MKKTKLGLFLYLFFVLQRFNVVANFILLFNLLFFVTNVVNMYLLDWKLYIVNIVIFFVTCAVKCLVVPIKEFITVISVGFFENTKLVDEVLELPTNLLEKVNQKLKR